jgi:hypothetical protein
MNHYRKSVLSFNQRRIVVAASLTLALLSSGNHLLGWGFGAPYTKKIMGSCFLILAAVVVRLLPTLQELSEHRERKLQDRKAGHS